MEKINWHNEARKVSELIPNPENPRQMSEVEVRRLNESLAKFGMADVVIVNLDNMIVGGHQRITLLRGEGAEDVDCRVPDRMLTPEEVRELTLRLNKNTGSWDFDKLANFDEDMLQDVGFDDEISKMLGDDKEQPELEFSEELLLEHNYVVLYFDNPMDWEVARDKLGIKEVKSHALSEKSVKRGTGRILNGKVWIEKLI